MGRAVDGGLDSTGVLKANLRQDGLEVIFADLLLDASQVELLPDGKEMTFTVKNNRSCTLQDFVL